MKYLYDSINCLGLDVPSIPQKYKADPIIEANSFREDWMQEGWFEFAALAQHNGLPTRLLDWTTDVKVALFFAMRGISDDEIESSPSKCMSIWVMDKVKASRLLGNIRFITSTYYNNPYIRAQSGLFTVLEGKGSEYCSLDEVIEKRYNEKKTTGLYGSLDGILKRMDVHYSNIPTFRNLLEKKGLNETTLFPSISRTVDSMLDCSPDKQS